jgi:hypothetical protein
MDLTPRENSASKAKSFSSVDSQGILTLLFAEGLRKRTVVRLGVMIFLVRGVASFDALIVSSKKSVLEAEPRNRRQTDPVIRFLKNRIAGESTLLTPLEETRDTNVA